MSRLPAALIACGALAALSACGSSGGATASSNGAIATRSGQPAKATSGPSESVKLDTTPKFASPSPSAPVQGGTVRIAYRNIAIAPDTVRVRAGSTIEWTNYDSTKANVTSVDGPMRFASEDFGEGGTFELKATKVGVIHYECTLYPATMNGTIEVVS